MPATQTAESDPPDGGEVVPLGQPSSPVEPDGPGGPVDPVAVLEARVAELEHEVEHLTRAVASRTVIGTAVGLLSERHRCTSDQAWIVLATLSNRANRKALDVARVLVAVADGDLAADAVPAAAELARHLPAALVAARLDPPRRPA